MASGSSMFGKGLSDQDMAGLETRFSNPETESDHRNLALFMVLSRTGLRASELLQLTFNNLIRTPEGSLLAQIRLKGRRMGYTLLPEAILSSVRKYHSHIGIEEDTFFWTLPLRSQSGRRVPLGDRGLRKVINSWGLKTLSGRQIHAHSIRHTVGQKLLDTAGSIACQKVLNHASPVTSAKFYTRPYYDGSELLNWS